LSQAATTGGAPATPPRLTVWRLSAFASIAFPGAGLILPLAIFLPPFYTKTLGLGLAEVGLVFMLVRMFDIVTDPVMGLIGDRFESRWGRRRHWLVIALPFLMLGVIMAFMPQGSPTVWYLGLWLVVLYAGSTMLTISHTAWAAELSPDYNERSRIASFNAFFGFVGSLVILLPLAVLEYQGAPPAGRDALQFFGIMVLILAPMTVFLAASLVGERKTAPAPRIGLIQGLLTVARNPHMRRLLAADAMAAMPGAVMAGLFIFYQAELIGKHRAFGLGCLAFCLTTFMFFFPGEGDVWLFIVFMFATGFAYSGLNFLLRAMAADVVDYDNVETGGTRTGLYFAMLAITAKLGGALAIGVTYPLLDLIGFDAQGGNSPETLLSFRIIYVVVPTLAMIAAYLGIRGFKLDRTEQSALQARIEARDGDDRAGEAGIPGKD
jgi:Na+/melibiose symporter-like transporter